MKRREFTKLTGLSIIAVTASGFIRFNGTKYIGDCETTSDILGPFYRPDSPERNNLVIKNMPGEIVELSGTVRHKDCSTPYKKAKVELWHCSHDEIYDNDSEEYRYRGTTFCDENGNYKFTTQMPVPYDAGGGEIRPAHFHLMFSAPGYKSLITQIYFKGDPYLEKDPSSASVEARQRILNIDKKDDVYKIVFDCNMSDQLKVTNTSLKKLTGKYKDEESGEYREYFHRDGELWLKNGVFGTMYEYVGENTFKYGGLPKDMYEKLEFKLKSDGKVLLIQRTFYGNGEEKLRTFLRT